MKSVKVRAKYMGQDGDQGFKKEQYYEFLLDVNTNIPNEVLPERAYICIQHERPGNLFPYAQIPYTALGFFNNWEDITKVK